MTKSFEGFSDAVTEDAPLDEMLTVYEWLKANEAIMVKLDIEPGSGERLQKAYDAVYDAYQEEPVD